jgi:hypothetical protein
MQVSKPRQGPPCGEGAHLWPRLARGARAARLSNQSWYAVPVAERPGEGATPNGEQALRAAMRKIKELFTEIVGGDAGAL